MPTLQQIYDQAASVRGETGVDPAIVATIMTTETNVSTLPVSLGITTGAPSGRGTSGAVIYPPNQPAGQPSAFWGYQNGAEAARALGNYIREVQPALAPLLGNAQAFFNPSGPISTSNYYVPNGCFPSNRNSPYCLQATYKYYADWLTTAQGFPSDISGSSPSVGIGLAPAAGGAGASAAESSTSTDPCARAGEGVLFGLGQVSVAFCRLGRTIQPLTTHGFWWAVLFFGLGLAALVAGVLLYFRPLDVSLQRPRATVGLRGVKVRA